MNKFNKRGEMLIKENYNLLLKAIKDVNKCKDISFLIWEDLIS